RRTTAISSRSIWQGFPGRQARGRDAAIRRQAYSVRPGRPPPTLEDTRIPRESAEVRVHTLGGRHPVPASVHLRHGSWCRGPGPWEGGRLSREVNDRPVPYRGLLRGVLALHAQPAGALVRRLLIHQE